MIKRNKLTILITSVVTLLPALLGLFGSKLLPDKIVQFWGLDVQTDTGANAASIFLLLPLIMLAVHWFCIILTTVMEKNNRQNKKIEALVLWITPVISVSTCGILLATAFSEQVNVTVFMWLLLGIGMIVIGNYLPKTTRNRTMGIKIAWTLANEDNWYATHRFAGKVFVGCGVACMLSILLPGVVQPFMVGGLLIVMLALPVIYSYRFYKKQLADGSATKQDYEQGLGDLYKSRTTAVIATVIVIASLGIIMPLIMFSGNVEIMANETEISIDADMWSDYTLPYDKIDSIEYRESSVDGQRISGVGSARLLLGIFRNAEFGSYTRYTYTGDLPCIVIKTGSQTLVIGTDNAQDTQALYNAITEKIGE